MQKAKAAKQGGRMCNENRGVGEMKNKKGRQEELRRLSIERMSFDIYRTIQNGISYVEFNEDELASWPINTDEQRDKILGISRIFAEVIFKVLDKAEMITPAEISDDYIGFMLTLLDKMSDLLDKFIKNLTISQSFIEGCDIKSIKEMSPAQLISTQSNCEEIFTTDFINADKKHQISFLAAFFVSSVSYRYDQYKQDVLAME